MNLNPQLGHDLQISPEEHDKWHEATVVFNIECISTLSLCQNTIYGSFALALIGIVKFTYSQCIQEFVHNSGM